MLVWCQWNVYDHMLKCGGKLIWFVNEVEYYLGEHKSKKIHVSKPQSYIIFNVGFCSPQSSGLLFVLNLKSVKIF